MRLHACVHGCGASPLSASPHIVIFDDSRLLTTLTTPCRAHQGQWTRRGPRLECLGDGEDAVVESQTERSGKLDWFGCGVGLHSAENNRCGVEGWPGCR